MPGAPSLAAELGVDSKTVWAAMQLLEKDGLLANQGAGKARKIVPPSGRSERRGLRIALLAYEQVDLSLDYVIELRHRLGEAGHVAFHPRRTLTDLKMSVTRIAELVAKTDADAWVVMASSREILEWFAGQDIPVFALFGRRRGLPIAGAGPEKQPAIVAATRRLIELGHRRIVMLTQRMRRLPEPGAIERAFLEELAAHDLPSGSFNLPDWEPTVEGFRERLDLLFMHTPPTALITDEAPFLLATMQYCGNRGLKVPDDVSLICMDPDPAFIWCHRPIAHIRWDSRPLVRRMVRWVNQISHGKDDRRQTFVDAEFVEGGTVGPATE